MHTKRAQDLSSRLWGFQTETSMFTSTNTCKTVLFATDCDSKKHQWDYQRILDAGEHQLHLQQKKQICSRTKLTMNKTNQHIPVVVLCPFSFWPEAAQHLLGHLDSPKFSHVNKVPCPQVLVPAHLSQHHPDPPGHCS